MREQPGIPEEQLRACLQDQYDFYPVTLEFLPRGKDYKAGVYRVVSEQSTAYLLKVTSRSLYEPRCLVPYYLKEGDHIRRGSRSYQQRRLVDEARGLDRDRLPLDLRGDKLDGDDQ